MDAFFRFVVTLRSVFTSAPELVRLVNSTLFLIPEFGFIGVNGRSIIGADGLIACRIGFWIALNLVVGHPIEPKGPNLFNLAPGFNFKTTEKKWMLRPAQRQLYIDTRP